MDISIGLVLKCIGWMDEWMNGWMHVHVWQMDKSIWLVLKCIGWMDEWWMVEWMYDKWINLMIKFINDC